MDEHALRVLGYRDLLDAVAQYAGTTVGQGLIRSLVPATDLRTILERQALTRDCLALREAGLTLPTLNFGDLADTLRRVAPEDAVLGGDELVVCRGFLAAVVQLKRFLAGEACLGREDLQEMQAALDPCGDLLAALTRSLDERGELLDGASPALAELRRRAYACAEGIQQRLHDLLRDSGPGSVFQERYVTVRNGRFVVPVRRDQKGRVDGVIHDHSDSGQTVFVEPAATLTLGNDLADTRLEERDECRRILADLCRRVRRQLPEFRRDQEQMALFDAAAAVSAWALDYACVFARLGRDVRVRAARHPLLDRQLRRDGGGRRVVPLDVELVRGHDVMVVTGSNSGGKTVALETVGLLVLAAQAGLPVPVGDGTELAIFDHVLADIGDEQSLQQNLSTFTGHMARVTQILREVRSGGRSLVLLDELGAGTDPLEGGALACAILAELQAAGCATMATTHLGMVKSFVHDRQGMVNAAVRFNSATLEPEYVLETGRPGASHALSIAARFGVPERVLATAREMLGAGHLKVEGMLGELEDAQRRLATQEQETRETLAQLSGDRDALREELGTLRAERRRLLHEAQQQAAQTVENTRRQMERLLKDLRLAETAEAREAAAAQARERLETQLQAIERAAAATAPKPARPLARGQLKVGQRVWVERLQALGRVAELPGDGRPVAVQVGGVRFEVEARELGRPAPGAEEASGAAPGAAGVRPLAAAVTAELNLVGWRVDAACGQLDKYLDRALLAGLPEVRVVHGFGTGRLREAVHEFLRASPLVRRYRLGQQGKDPGGAGATLVELHRRGGGP